MSKVYSLDAIDTIVLQKTFNYGAIDNPYQQIFTRLMRAWTGQRDHITLGEVYRAIADDKTFPEIQDEIPDISSKTILLARAFYSAVNPNGAHMHHRRQYLRVLCDANIDESYATDGARDVFGYASHINFEGLTHAKDSKIWAVASGKFNLIITKDCAVKPTLKTMDTIDLTRCVLLRWKGMLKVNGGVVDAGIRALPVLIHIRDADLSGRQIRNLLRKHRDAIFEIYDERVSPVIEVGRNQVKPGVHFLDLIEGGTKKRVTSLRDRIVQDVTDTLFGRILHTDSTPHTKAIVKRAVEHHISDEMSRLQTPAERQAFLNRIAEPEAGADILPLHIWARLEKTLLYVQDPLELPLASRMEKRAAGRPVFRTAAALPA